MVKTGKDALALVRRHKVVPMTAVEGFRSLVEEVAGGPVRGSWWGHPQGARMYDLANLLHDSKDILAAKLLDGKVTFIHRSLWPALFRIVSDAGRRRSRVRRMGPIEKRILATVEEGGRAEAEQLTIRWGVSSKTDRKEFKKAIDRLAQALELWTGNVHTDAGHHVTVLRAWTDWADASTRRAAQRMSLEEAQETLREACGGSLHGLS